MILHSILYIILAILGLNLLVFIHELGHYILARRNGMKVETFSIGFGKPLIKWMRKGVKWQICPILFGGYVKIAGMEKEGNLEPYEVPEGFYSKKPWARIKVALAGPVVNLVFALVAFTAIWALGGREKPFSQFTQVIGYVDPQSELYQNGVRAGDLLKEYNDKPYQGYQDLIFAAIANGRPANLEGVKIDYLTQKQTPYDFTVTPYESTLMPMGLKTTGIISSASYLIYHESLFDNLPIKQSGIEPNDRIVWVNGEFVFSNEQLSQILNSGKTLVTIERSGKILLGKVPRMSLQDLRLSGAETAEIDDWKYAAGYQSSKEEKTFIPYLVSSDMRVEKGLFYINEESKVASIAHSFSHDLELKAGDRILAVDGIPVDNPVALLKALQTPHVQMIVKRGEKMSPISWKVEDQVFLEKTDWDALAPLANSVGMHSAPTSNGSFHLLKPFNLIRFKEIPFSEEVRKHYKEELEQQLLAAEKIPDAELREQALAEIHAKANRFALGAAISDRKVIFNPNPFALFGSVFKEIVINLSSLFSGSVSAKHFGGPLFIVGIMKSSWSVGFKEALFWLGAISLNLGILNLLPIPVLDGGHICFSLLEKLRGKPLKAKTMQRLVIPFVALLIFLFVYLTYNDILRFFT